MAVYTPLAPTEVKSHLNQYDVGQLIEYQPATSGIENTNYIITTDQGRYVLTIFEDRTPEEHLPFVLDYMQLLRSAELPVADVIMSKSGKAILTIKNKASLLVRFLSGEASTAPCEKDCAQFGHLIARMHIAAQDFTSRRENPVGLPAIGATLNQLQAQPNHPYKDAVALASKTYQKLKSQPLAHVPSGVVHADLFPDNVFFLNGEISGVIDFYFACTENFIVDIAIGINAWAQESKGVFCTARAQAIISAYQSIRPLTREELDNFPHAFQFAALRFLTTRLFDWTKHQAHAIVEKKDPMEYAELLKFHLNEIDWLKNENN